MTGGPIPTHGSELHVDDEWVYGQVCRMFRLSGEAYASNFLQRHFGLRPGLPFESQMRVVIESECFGSVEPVGQRASFKSYFEHFVGADGACWRGETPDLYTAGRCHNEKGTVARGHTVLDSLRDCPMCTNELYEKEGFATWLRSHNLPGVTVCWRHEIRLRERSDFKKLPLPARTDEVAPVPATQEELWFANLSREALLDERGTARYALHGSPESKIWRALLLAKSVVETYSASLLSAWDLSPAVLTAGYRSILGNQRSIGDTRLLILAAHCTDRTTRLIFDGPSCRSEVGAWRKAATQRGLGPAELNTWVKADRLEPLAA